MATELRLSKCTRHVFQKIVSFVEKFKGVGGQI